MVTPILPPGLGILRRHARRCASALFAMLMILGCGHAETSTVQPSAVSGTDVSYRVTEISSAKPTVGFDPEVILPPAWAFGVLHGYYTNQTGLLENFRRLEAGNFPVDAIWIDSAFWDLSTFGPEGYLDFKGDREAFPDLPGLTAELAKHQVRFGIWVWDRILDANRETYHEFESQGFFRPGRIVSNGWHNVENRSVARSVDFSNPAAVALWTEKLRPFLAAGVDFFKIDAEPQSDYLRTHFEMSQRFGHHTKGRGFVLTQSARKSAADIKRYPAAWTGDAQSSWHQPDYPDTRRWILGGLRQQIEMVANPTWRHYQYPFLANDTGGFHPREFKGAAAEELYIRWAQFSSFGSIMQVFGAPTVPWQNAPFGWSEAAQENFRRHTHLRLRLFPYIYTHALRTRLTGLKMIQGEAQHRFQFTFGDAFLVAPVHEPGVTNRKVWLPPENVWTDYWTGATYAGGQEIVLPVTLDHLPLLVRAGAIIPMRDYAPSVLRGSNATLTLDVYPEGAPADSQFTLYEDDGTSNDYLTNGFAATTITCRRRPAGQKLQLQIEPIVGSYEGRLAERHWKVQIHLRARPGAVQLNDHDIPWQYDERAAVLRLEWTAPTTGGNEVVVTTAPTR
jgi:alpha-glucosidase (family GH31 glycosyl hydrolase)